MHTLFKLIVLIALPQVSFADVAQPPWLQPDVLRAAGTMALTEAQLPQFRTAVTDLVDNLTTASNQLMRRHNVSNRERRMKTLRNRQFTKMDKFVAGFLTDAQYPKYMRYRDLLKEHMASAAMSRAGRSDDAMKANAALLDHGIAQRHCSFR